MSIKFARKLSLGAFKAAFADWVARRAAISMATSRRPHATSPLRPCPGVYALLVDIHRNH